jgi:hypothetical protein
VWSISSRPGAYLGFQAQTYRAQPVLTWWYGMGGPAGGDIGKGTCMLAALDRTPVAAIGISGAFVPDAHELRLTLANTALITSYLAVPCDLSTVGGLAIG